MLGCVFSFVFIRTDYCLVPSSTFFSEPMLDESSFSPSIGVYVSSPLRSLEHETMGFAPQAFVHFPSFFRHLTLIKMTPITTHEAAMTRYTAPGKNAIVSL